MRGLEISLIFIEIKDIYVLLGFFFSIVYILFFIRVMVWFIVVVGVWIIKCEEI